jgi:hypothetical protein
MKTIVLGKIFLHGLIKEIDLMAYEPLQQNITTDICS